MKKKIFRKRLVSISIIVVLIVGSVSGYYFLAQSNANKLKILGCGYFFGPAPHEPNKNITYVYLNLSAPLFQRDSIHIYKFVGYPENMYYNMAVWRVNSTQNGKSNITIPVNMLENLNGTMNIDIKRGKSYLYHGEISFFTKLRLNASVEVVRVRPTSIKYAFITKVCLLIVSEKPVYISGVNVKIFNMTLYKSVLNVIFGSREVNISVENAGKNVQLVRNGILPIKVTLFYPTYPYDEKPGKYTISGSYTLNFTYSPVTIINYSVEYGGLYTELYFNLNKAPEYPVHLVVCRSNGAIIGKGYGWGKDENGTVFMNVDLWHDYNFNGTYIGYLIDEYGFVIDVYTFTLKAGPLQLISHTEKYNETDKANRIILRSIILRLKNLGNSMVRITYYRYTITYAVNGTKVVSGDYPWFYGVVSAGKIANLTLPFYVKLFKGNKYSVFIEFHGGNGDVKYTLKYKFIT